MQKGARFLQPATIEQRRALLPRLAEFTNDYPWNWQCADLEEFIATVVAKPIVVSTARIYEITLRMFLDYVTDPHYGWPQECRERFGVAPRQLLHEENSIVPVTEQEGDPRRRPLTYDEIQAMFDAADAHVEQIRAHHCKGATAAMRDATLLKSVYAYGIRRREARRPPPGAGSAREAVTSSPVPARRMRCGSVPHRRSSNHPPGVRSLPRRAEVVRR
ncbi:hypothetical protein ACFVKB_32530 [Rhodococcus sp. NPDC127530]|uniref:hypothetical protein n=1 Tax=unclassified Rhodococcus (in: high G+C Gram-positive bacteria) TaxID=192944 RepID=UPI00362F88AE